MEEGTIYFDCDLTLDALLKGLAVIKLGYLLRPTLAALYQTNLSRPPVDRLEHNGSFPEIGILPSKVKRCKDEDMSGQPLVGYPISGNLAVFMLRNARVIHQVSCSVHLRDASFTI